MIKEITMISYRFKSSIKKGKHWFSFLFLFFFINFLGFSQLNAMIKDISLKDLVKKSDVIAVVDVLAVKSVGNMSSGVMVIANLVKVDQPLKGGVAVGEKLKIKTRDFEDNADLKKGLKTLLFLKQVGNYYEVVSGIAGTWPVTEDGRLVGYGTGKSISDIEKVIEEESKENTPVPEESSNKDEIVISI